MKIISYLKSWFRVTETSRGQLIVGFLVTLFISFAINSLVYQSGRNDESIDDISSLSNDLNVLAGAFVTSLMDDPTNASTAKADLSAAIIRLHSEISAPKVTFDAKATVYAESAKVSLEELSDIVARVKGPEDLGAFWPTMAIFISSRNKILKHYRS